jgi:hypothetical protein
LNYPEIISNLKDWAQIIALPAAVLAAIKAIYELRESRLLRAEELRWKRANAAKELVDDIHNHEFEKNAVHMLDWSDGQAQYEIAPGRKEMISYRDVLAALAKNSAQSSDAKDAYIRDCFDWFFYRVDRIQHYIHRGLIDFEDVRAIFKIYANEISKNWETYDKFLAFHEYDLAREFFLRCKDAPA